MTELTVDETIEKLPLILEGKGNVDDRAVLEADLNTASHKEPRRFYALNDAVVARGATGRLVNIEGSIDGVPLTTFRADGVVLATATGCTGYALAAGGPILHPQSQDFVLVPILPHLSYAFPMVLPSTTVSTLALAAPNPGMLSIDGHINVDLACGDVITVKHSSYIVRFLRIHDTNFYESLEQRLKGKQPGDARRKS
jgi:NAD+ kinase